MKMDIRTFFEIWLILGLSAIAFLWGLDILTTVRRRLKDRRTCLCPNCGSTSHPAPSVLRHRCRQCGLLFEIHSDLGQQPQVRPTAPSSHLQSKHFHS